MSDDSGRDRASSVARLRTVGGVYAHVADFVERDVSGPTPGGLPGLTTEGND
jgi:hypothetical protein